MTSELQGWVLKLGNEPNSTCSVVFREITSILHLSIKSQTHVNLEITLLGQMAFFLEQCRRAACHFIKKKMAVFHHYNDLKFHTREQMDSSALQA